MLLQLVETYAIALMKEFGLQPEFWRFKWNNSYRRCGMCKYPWFNEEQSLTIGTIELSRYYVACNSFEDIDDTLRHEIAHALTKPDVGHGPEWVAMCLVTGAKPRTKANGRVAPPGRWSAVCPCCGKTHYQYRKPKTDRQYNCVQCGPERGIVTFVDGGLNETRHHS